MVLYLFFKIFLNTHIYSRLRDLNMFTSSHYSSEKDGSPTAVASMMTPCTLSLSSSASYGTSCILSPFSRAISHAFPAAWPMA